MQPKNYWTGVVIIIASVLALAALLVGYRSSDSPAQRSVQTTLSEPTVTADGLPEVVVTARRNSPKTVALSEGDTDIAASSPSRRVHPR
jgi:hypothetical protein